MDSVPHLFNKVISVSLSIAFFITNVVGAQTPNNDSRLQDSEASFWTERQKAVARRSSLVARGSNDGQRETGDKQLLLAQLPGNPPISPFIKGHTSIPSFSTGGEALSSFRKGGLGRIIPDITGIEAKAKQQSAVNIPHTIAKNGPGWLRSLPYNYGTLEEVLRFK